MVFEIGMGGKPSKYYKQGTVDTAGEVRTKS